MTATLYIVATPIGNLADISQRALDTLRAVDIVAAEDTRHSQKLLQHYGISTPLISLHDHNEQQRAGQLIKRLQVGTSVALISDAGTPLISDPGYALVNQCRQAGIDVIPIPGACAAIAALCAAGLPTDRFVFAGFLPVKQQAKQQALAALVQEQSTVIFYESPRRIATTVAMIVECLGADRPLVLAKELTKSFETFFSGSAQLVLNWLEADANHQRGEFVLMIGGAEQLSEIPAQAIDLLKQLMPLLPLKKAAAVVAQHYDLKKNALYQLGLEMRE